MHTGGGGHRGGERRGQSPATDDSATGQYSAARSGLYGRERELDAVEILIRQMTSRAAEATGALGTGPAEPVLLVRGEPGSGKSALLTAAGQTAQAAGVAVLTAAGAPSEAAIPFAGLHHLLQPLLDRANELPGRQREALEGAFGLSGEAQPDPLPVALATLTLVGSASPAGQPPGTPRSVSPAGRPPGTPRSANPGGRPPGIHRSANPGERAPGTPGSVSPAGRLSGTARSAHPGGRPSGTSRAAGLGEPVLLIIDDAQWLDPSSSTVLGLVARRLAGRPAAMVVASRYWPPTPLVNVGLPELSLDELAEDTAAAMLVSQTPDIELPMRDRLVREADGNPLALAELSRSVPPALIGDDSLVPLSADVPLPGRLEQALAGQVSELPDATRAVLLIAATDDRDGIGELLDAASILAGTAVNADALSPAIAARLVEVRQTSLRFRHQLVNTAIYQAASLAQRQAAHAALARVLADQPDRQIWHKAAAALGPDEPLAEALDEAATKAQRRGAVAIAASALERAAELSNNEARRGTRLLRAAELAFDSGHPGLGPQLLKAAEPLDLRPRSGPGCPGCARPTPARAGRGQPGSARLSRWPTGSTPTATRPARPSHCTPRPCAAGGVARTSRPAPPCSPRRSESGYHRTTRPCWPSLALPTRSARPRR